MALHLLKNARYLTSVKVEDNMVILTDQINDVSVILNNQAYDEMVEHVKEERKEPLPTFEDVKGVLEDKKGEVKDD